MALRGRVAASVFASLSCLLAFFAFFVVIVFLLSRIDGSSGLATHVGWHGSGGQPLLIVSDLVASSFFDCFNALLVLVAFLAGMWFLLSLRIAPRGGH
jgi:hypothetical protein